MENNEKIEVKYDKMLKQMLQIARETYPNVKFMFVIEDNWSCQLICDQDYEFCEKASDKLFNLFEKNISDNPYDYPDGLGFLSGDYLNQIKDNLDILVTTEKEVIMNLINKGLLNKKPL